jgi:hypothetical protein
MKEMIILVHLASKTAYASGNKQFFNKSKDELFYIIQDIRKHGDNQNFLKWAETFNSENDFDYLFIKCSDEGQAKKQSKILIDANNWTEISKQTEERTVEL